MKRRIKISLIAITCFGVLCPITANAQNPLDKLIPRGTLFKKLKQDILGEFGSNKAKTPTPRQAPTPAATASRPNHQASTQPLKQQRQPTMATRPLPPMNNSNQAPSSPSQVVQHQGTQPAGIDASAGFGAIVQMAKNNQLVVTRLNPQGNAIKAGLKPGDIVKTVGSVKLTSVQAYSQVSQGLKPGDQMEFEVVRRGRPEKLLVAYGTAPVEMQVTTGGSPEFNAPTGPYVSESAVALEGMPSVLDTSMPPAAHVSRLPQMAPSVVAVPGATEKRLNRTIESQRAKMERMENELEMLRKTNTPAIRPTENNWALPQLGAPN